MGINKKMPVQEIGLYRIAKEKKAMHERKEMVEESMMIMAMSKEMKAPMHNIIMKKKK